MHYAWPVTVKPTGKMGDRIRGSIGYCGDKDPELEDIPRLRRAVGFCTNPHCFGRPRKDHGSRYLVSGLLGVVYKATEDHDLAGCPSCQHGLFWGSSWEYLDDAECKKRGLQTLSELYERQRAKSI